MKLIFLFALLLNYFQGKAQSTVSGTIQGSLDKTINNVNVLLLRATDPGLVKGMLTDANGYFLFKDIQTGNYFINSTHTGFYPYNSEIFSISAGNHKDIGFIHLYEKTMQLGEVILAAKKPLLEQKSDRLILNVGSLPTFSGNNALQVLQKAPGVVVQENLNSISLNNKGGALIMINDRVSRVPMSTLIQQVKGMRAENIDRIELIYQPGVKYDSDNAAGIIHIVMKENTLYGTNGSASLTAGIGQREKVNGSIALNYRNDRFNVYGNITGFHSRSPLMHLNHYRKYEYQGDQYNYENQVVFTNPQNYSLGFNLGADYEMNKENIIGFLFGFSKSKDFSGHDLTSTSKGSINGILFFL